MAILNFLLLNNAKITILNCLPLPEEFDAFNDDTFGDAGGGVDTEWNEDAHEALAAMTEEEMKAVQVG